MIGRLWWDRLVNSVRFIEDTQDLLSEGKSVILNFDNEIPWQDELTDILGQRLAEMTDSKSSEIYDVSGVKQPGLYLFEHFCSESERKKYWPTKHLSHERFLASSRETPLCNRFVFITGIDADNSEAWVESVSEYMENVDPETEHGIFILLVKNKLVKQSKWLEYLKYEDYVSDYDCMMLCLTLISELSCSRTEKMYLCETASNIAHNNVEHAGMLVSEELELIKKPLITTEKVYQENGITITDLEETVNVAVWEAQLKLVFPKLENFRAELIRKHESKIKKYLPIKSSNGENITKASDLETGQLYYICKENKADKIIDYNEYEMLKKMRDARNLLAHRETLNYNQLKELEII